MRIELFCDDRGVFTSAKSRRILIYWPHGFGDFVHLSLITTLLDPANAYFITRFGDDFVHLYDDDAVVKPLYSGVRAIGDGSNLGVAPNLGLDFDRLEYGEHEIEIPEPLNSRMHEVHIDALLACRYPEVTGRVPYPYQTKARYLAHQLVAPERLRTLDLSAPLRSSLGFRAPAEATHRVEARLRDLVAAGERLYVLSPGGHTQVDKRIDDALVGELAQAVRLRDPLARVMCIDERTSVQIGRDPQLAPTTTDLFEQTDVSFAHLFLAMLRAAHAFVGAAAGPLHAALAAGLAPTVGVWLSHWPEYYDEPSRHALHLVGPRVYRDRLDRRIGAVTKAQANALPYAIRAFRNRPPMASDVIDALEELGALR